MNQTTIRTVPSRSARGFTLVELLVVIGIIALLISILLPTLASARRSANNVACLSNQRQLGQTLTFFTNDHDGYVVKAWFNGQARGTNAIPGGSRNTNWGFEPEIWGWDYVLKTYMDGATGVFRCPSDSSSISRGQWNNVGAPDAGRWPATGGADRTIDDIPASYRINISNQTEDILAYKVTELTNATQAIVFADGNASTFHQVESWDPSPVANGSLGAIGAGKEQIANAAVKRHSAPDQLYRGDPLSPNAEPVFKFNAAFADGHGETVTWAQSWEVLGEPVTYKSRGGPDVVGVPTMWRQLFRGNDLVDTYDNPYTDDDNGNPFPG